MLSRDSQRAYRHYLLACLRVLQDACQPLQRTVIDGSGDVRPPTVVTGLALRAACSLEAHGILIGKEIAYRRRTVIPGDRGGAATGASTAPTTTSTENAS